MQQGPSGDVCCLPGRGSSEAEENSPFSGHTSQPRPREGLKENALAFWFTHPSSPASAFPDPQIVVEKPQIQGFRESTSPWQRAARHGAPRRACVSSRPAAPPLAGALAVILVNQDGLVAASLSTWETLMLKIIKRRRRKKKLGWLFIQVPRMKCR